MPLYMSAMLSMRGLATHPNLFPSFSMESPLWLDSLALPDQTCAMPVLMAALMLTNLEVFGSIDTQLPAMDGQAAGLNIPISRKYQRWLMRGGTLVSIPMLWNFSSATFVFMMTNMVTASVLNRTLDLQAVSRFFEIPPKPLPGTDLTMVRPLPALLPTTPELESERPRMIAPRSGTESGPPRLLPVVPQGDAAKVPGAAAAAVAVVHSRTSPAPLSRTLAALAPQAALPQVPLGPLVLGHGDATPHAPSKLPSPSPSRLTPLKLHPRFRTSHGGWGRRRRGRAPSTAPDAVTTKSLADLRVGRKFAVRLVRAEHA
eukprot:NODE_1375_length_1162_cov_158.635050.p1 GENE.NODE_1375_length_1162_cov_158.635050~~NODE_1375_length_1162_cov_158.635050.p1  ORF type:complete len:363 (-),score=93.57 NODE_1375_length_1162_cov_158.635050:57-1004(-)